MKNMHVNYSKSSGAERIMQRRFLIEAYDAYLEKHSTSRRTSNILRARYQLMMERSDSRRALLKNIKKSEIGYIPWFVVEEMVDQKFSFGACFSKNTFLDKQVQRNELSDANRKVNTIFV
jgi:hypothetical protein